MPQKRFDKDKLLKKQEVLAILNCYFVKGIKKGIRFSEFEKMFKNKDLYLLLRKKIDTKDPKDTLERRLKQMKRAGLLYQKKAKGPYFLNEKWYNLPLKNLNKELIDQTPLNQISFDTPYPGFQDLAGSDFWCGTILYGMNLENLPENYRIMVLREMRAATKALAEIYYIKDELIGELVGRWYNNIIRSKFGAKIKNLKKIFKLELSNILKDVAMLSIDLVCGEIPSREWVKETVEMYQETNLLPEFFKDDVFIDTIFEINKELVKFYPFDDICFSSFGTFLPEKKEDSSDVSLSLKEVFL